MRRRQFIAVLGGGAVVGCGYAAAQQKLPVIGFLGGQSAGSFAPYAAAFRDGLREAGFTEGRNVAIEARWAEGRVERLPEMAAELVRLPVAVIAATGGVIVARAAKAATTTIPIVFNSGEDPVEAGLVNSLSRPGGNMTGVSWFSTELAEKRLQLLQEVVPTARVIGLLVDPNSPESLTQPQRTEAAAVAGGRRLIVVKAGTPAEIGAAFVALAQQHADALVVGAGAFFYGRSKQIIELAAQHRLAAIYLDRRAVADGGLISYGNDLADAYRRNALYVARILKGDKPGDLPVDRSTRFDLVINMTTAKALGLTLPRSLLSLADNVIE